MNNWPLQELRTLCHRIGDGLHGTPAYVENEAYKFINGNNIRNGQIQYSKLTKNVSESTWLSNHIELDKNSLLLSINGTLGGLAFYNGEKVMLGKSVAYLNFKSDINRFYYYYFQLNAIQKHFHNIATGSTIKNLSLASIQELRVPVPPREAWEPIVNVLESIDRVISTNKSAIAELRNVSRLIYQNWFKHFEFPNDDGLPYRSNGGALRFDSSWKTQIPTGWKIQNLLENDLASLIDPGLEYFPNQKRYLATADVDVYAVNWDASFVDYHSRETRANMQPCLNSVWFAKMKNSKKILVLGETSADFVSETILSTGFAGLRTSAKFLEYIAHVIDDPEFEKRKDHLANGATQEAINKQAMSLIPILVPAENVLEVFHQRVSSALKTISILNSENQTLDALRKTLIPELMSQSISVR